MASKCRKLGEARLSKLIRAAEREPPSWEGPFEPELQLTELKQKRVELLYRTRKGRADAAK